MRFKITILLVLLNCLQIIGMASDEQPELIEGWNKLPDELCLFVMSFAANADSTSQVLKQLAKCRLVNKGWSHLCSDISLMKALILHLSDYETVLNKALCKAACVGNCNVIELLSKLPSAPKPASKHLVVTNLDGSEDECIEPGTELDCKEISFIEANLNTVGFFGYTPLLHAAERGHKKFVQMLLNMGALVVVKNSDNETALILASKKGHLKIVKKLLFFELVRIYINLEGFGGNTAFLWAAKQSMYASEKNKEDNYLAIVKLLAEHGADVNASDASDLSVMDWAAKEGTVRLITELLDLKVRFSKENKSRLEIYFMGMPVNEENAELFGKIKVLEEKTVKVSKVKLQLRNEPCWLSFKIGGIVYKTEIENETINHDFINKISTLEDSICTGIGDAIVEKVIVAGATPNSIVRNSSSDANDYRLAFDSVFGEILFEVYFLTKESANVVVMNKMRQLVKPIFKAYPEKHTSIYGHNLEFYGIND